MSPRVAIVLMIIFAIVIAKEHPVILLIGSYYLLLSLLTDRYIREEWYVYRNDLVIATI